MSSESSADWPSFAKDVTVGDLGHFQAEDFRIGGEESTEGP